MPCYDPRPSDYEVSKQERLNTTTKLLCGVLTRLKSKKILHTMLKENKELREWWKEHQELDKKRKTKKK